MRARGRFTIPRVPALPTVTPPDQLVSLAGVPWFSDGTTWTRVGAPAAGTAVVDAGTVPTPEVTATVAVAGLQAGVAVNAWLAHTAPGKDDDEVPMDVVHTWAYVESAGVLTIRLTGLSGFIHGQFTVRYTTA